VIKALEKVGFGVLTETGVRSIVRAIEKARAKANTPAWPWNLFAIAMRTLPLSVVARMS
jgi:hypothetical protein